MNTIADALDSEIRGELQRHGIVVWLDRDASFNSFVDALIARRNAGQFAHPVVAFRGSFLEVMLALEPFGSGLDSTPLLIHLPGFNEDSVRSTPVLELYRAGARFRKSFDTLIRETARGLVPPADIDAFLASGAHTVEEADAWLVEKHSTAREGFDATLRVMGITGVLDALVTRAPSFFGQEFTDAKVDVMKAFLHRHTGIEESWYEFYPAAPNDKPVVGVANAFIAYLLCVEYADDLARDPIIPTLRALKSLQTPLLKLCKELVQHVREHSPERYIEYADEVESHLQEELPAIRPEDLGRIDTFRIEESRVLEAAIGALRKGEWSKATDWAVAREGDNSFWLQRDQSRRWAWTLVAEAAALGQTIAANLRPLSGAKTLEEAADQYARSGAIVDRAHRRFEQQQDSLLKPRLPYFGELQEVLRSLRVLYREWADNAARDFTAICRGRGFLPEPALQQRNIYDDVVHPMATGNQVVAYFIIDAFRFEMATELLESLQGSNTIADLKPRLAELPTLTSVGMNVLAPIVKNGKLTLAKPGRLEGFRTGEFAVNGPDDRIKAMAARTSKPLLLALADVCKLTETELRKQLKNVKLVVVHSREIDDAGEANAGPQFFDRALQTIRAAVHHLQSAGGITQFVFTADHGFLLQDETTLRATYGKRTDPSRRHVLSEDARAEAGLACVSFEALGYEGGSGHLLFREDTRVFDTGGKDTPFFVHGGNSPQERIIPVLTIRRKIREAPSFAQYVVEAEATGDVLGHRCVRIRVKVAESATGTLGFMVATKLDLDIRVPDREDIRTTVRDARAPGSYKNGRLTLPVGGDWTDVFFALEGQRDERVRIEVFHPEAIARVEGASPEGLFAVDGILSARTPSEPPAAERALDWQDRITDEGARKVFLHLAKHGVVTEVEVHHLVGSPRAARRFALEFENHVQKVPFLVRIETTADGKRYVREGEK